MGTRFTSLQASVSQWLAALFLFLAGAFIALTYRTCAGEPSRGAPLSLQTEPNCQLGKRPCRATGVPGELVVSTSPQPRPLTAFAVRVRFVVAEATRREVGTPSLEFEMEGMDMGQNRYHMVRAEAGSGWTAEVMLPLCSRRRLDWQLSVWLPTSGRALVAQFPLQLAR